MFRRRLTLPGPTPGGDDPGMKPTPKAVLRRLVFPGERQVLCEDTTLPAPGPGEVLIAQRWSLMSTGTEGIVFGRRFDPGTGWDSWVKYPFYPGYAAVGVVAACGPGVVGIAVGDRVASRSPHASHAVCPAASVLPLPPGIDERAAAWFAMAKIAAMGARVAPMALADRVLVIGAGPVGQMSLRWALAAGAERAVVLDAQPWRLALATRAGASAVIDRPVAEARDAVLAAFGGDLPNLVIDATGYHEVLAHALPLAAKFGTVLVIGDTGRPAQQHLTHDLVSRGLRIIGAHDTHEDAEWSLARVARLFFSLASSGRFPLDGMISHTFKPEQCAEAYDLADRRRGETMGILFDWTES
jgi:2-desacetyl-2-hydroxyethyl bacteriochlorophyllide A dehydrogenase